MKGCEAVQYSDQKCCDRCGLVWDMNDPEPPECMTDEEIQAEINRKGIAKARKVLNEH